MKRILFLLAIVFFCISLFSCSKGCGSAGEVTIGGQTIEFVKALAYKDKKPGGYTLYLFNHGKTTCSELIKGYRKVHRGEVAFRLYMTPDGRWQSVGVGAHTQLGIKVKLVKKPSKAGDTLEMCLPSTVSFKPSIGAAKNKRIKASGLFKGKYCGEMNR